jgi:hypothetical protein
VFTGLGTVGRLYTPKAPTPSYSSFSSFQSSTPSAGSCRHSRKVTEGYGRLRKLPVAAVGWQSPVVLWSCGPVVQCGPVVSRSRNRNLPGPIRTDPNHFEPFRSWKFFWFPFYLNPEEFEAPSARASAGRLFSGSYSFAASVVRFINTLT